MTYKNDPPRSSLQRALNRRRIISKRRQGQRSREHPDAFGSQRPDDFGPTRSVSPSTVHQYNTHILTHWFSPVLRDQLIGDVIQVRTDDLRLRADSQDVVAHHA